MEQFRRTGSRLTVEAMNGFKRFLEEELGYLMLRVIMMVFTHANAF